MTYPDILWRGEFQPRSEEREEEEEEHISSNESANFNQICWFFVFTAGKIVFFRSNFLVVSESAVVALLLEVRLAPPPVAPITAGGELCLRQVVGTLDPSPSFGPV